MRVHAKPVCIYAFKLKSNLERERARDEVTGFADIEAKWRGMDGRLEKPESYAQLGREVLDENVQYA